MKPNHVTEAMRAEMKRLRNEGASFTGIGKKFGFTGSTVRCAIDPVYAEHRRERVNFNRDRASGYIIVPPVREKPEERIQERDPIALTETYSIRPYAMRVPNRTALGTNFLTEKAECHWVSLPRLSIQGRAA